MTTVIFTHRQPTVGWRVGEDEKYGWNGKLFVFSLRTIRLFCFAKISNFSFWKQNLDFWKAQKQRVKAENSLQFNLLGSERQPMSKVVPKALWIRCYSSFRVSLLWKASNERDWSAQVPIHNESTQRLNTWLYLLHDSLKPTFCYLRGTTSCDVK